MDKDNKARCFGDGEARERLFCGRFPQFQLEINPEKKWCPWSLDLISTKTGELSDLKWQGTPFCSMHDPQFGFVINIKTMDDLNAASNEYKRNPFVWIWIQYGLDKEGLLKLANLNDRYGSRMESNLYPMEGVWRIYYNDLQKAISEHGLIHKYPQRSNGNAIGSYYISLRSSSSFERMYMNKPKG